MLNKYHVPKARSPEFWIEPKHTFEMFHGVTKFERLLILTTWKENSDKCHILVYADPYKLLWITQQQLRECSSTSTSHFFLAQGVTFDGLDAYRTNVDLRCLSTLFIACSQMHFRLLTERICRSECMWNQEKKNWGVFLLVLFFDVGLQGLLVTMLVIWLCREFCRRGPDRTALGAPPAAAWLSSWIKPSFNTGSAR
jgi:hypothetical protein